MLILVVVLVLLHILLVVMAPKVLEDIKILTLKYFKNNSFTEDKIGYLKSKTVFMLDAGKRMAKYKGYMVYRRLTREEDRR